MAGRKRFEPTEHQRELVKALLAFGVPLANVCRFVLNPQTGRPVSYNVLARVFRNEIATAVDHANYTIAKNLYRIASKDSDAPQVVQAAIFWLRTRGGWKVADAATVPPPAQPDTPAMVDNEENARAIVEDVLNRYGRKRLTG